MAKKKTIEAENIKAAPVLRASSGGNEPTPTPEQTGTRTYQIMDPWKDKDVVNLVDVKAVDGEITEVKVNGQPAGGGGPSDGLLITQTRNADEILCLNKTWNEINTAYSAQLPIMYYKVDTYPTLEAFGYVSRCVYTSRVNTYYVDVYMDEGTTTYLCTNADERPHIEL